MSASKLRILVVGDGADGLGLIRIQFSRVQALRAFEVLKRDMFRVHGPQVKDIGLEVFMLVVFKGLGVRYVKLGISIARCSEVSFVALMLLLLF